MVEGICGNVEIGIGFARTATGAVCVTVINPRAVVNGKAFHSLTVINILSECFSQNVRHSAVCKLVSIYNNNVTCNGIGGKFVRPLQAVCVFNTTDTAGSEHAARSVITRDLAAVNTVVHLAGVSAFANDSTYVIIAADSTGIITIIDGYFIIAGSSHNATYAARLSIGSRARNGSVIYAVCDLALKITDYAANSADCADRTIIDTVGSSRFRIAARIAHNAADVLASRYSCIVNTAGNRTACRTNDTANKTFALNIRVLQRKVFNTSGAITNKSDIILGRIIIVQTADAVSVTIEITAI